MNGGHSRVAVSIAAILLSCVSLSATPLTSPARASGNTEPGRYIVVFHSWIVEDPGDLARAHIDQYGGRLGFVYRHALKGYSVSELPESAVGPIRSDPNVKFVEPDHLVSTPPFPLVPPEPPSIDRQWVTDVTSNDATLHAEINPNGLTTSYELQIDTTGSFKFFQTSSCPLNVPGVGCAMVIVEGDTLAPGLVQPVESSLPAGTGSQLVSVNMAAIGATLQPNTTYYYRALAASGPEVVAGSTQTFTTPPLVVGPADLPPQSAEATAGSVLPAGIALTASTPEGSKRRGGTACKRLRRLSGKGRSRAGMRKRCARSATARLPKGP